jgi:hypothetical protein
MTLREAQVVAVVAGVIASGAVLIGQQALPPPFPPGPVPFEVPLKAPMWTQADPIASADVTFEMVAPPLGTEHEPIAGAPYSAEALTEMVQTLADGNRIARQSSAAVFRDGAGRVRREGGLAMLGPLVGGGHGPRLISISDPAAGVTYLLDPEARTARKMTPPRFIRSRVAGTGTAGERIEVEEAAIETAPTAPAGAARTMAVRIMKGGPELPQPVTESLGQRLIEGVEADGTRSTVTIPAGQIGNEQPITIVTERWFSPALKVVVESRRADPRFGETTYRLTGIVRAEPAPSLFEVPPEYKVIDDQPAFFFKSRGASPSGRP